MDLSLQHKIVKGEIDVNNQELFIRTLFRALLYNLNNQITCRDKKIPHFVLNTGDDILYLENKGQNAAIEQFVDTHHEAVLRLIEMSAQNAHKHGAWIGICGELAADTTLTESFLRMGIDELSVSPSFVLKVRDAVRRCNLSE